MEVHTNVFEVAPNRTPTPLAAVEAEHAQGRQSADLNFFPSPHIPLQSFHHLHSMGQQLWARGKSQGGLKVWCLHFSLYPRKGNRARLGKGGNVCCLWSKTERWDSKTQVLLPCCPSDFSKAELFLVSVALSLNCTCFMGMRRRGLSFKSLMFVKHFRTWWKFPR